MKYTPAIKGKLINKPTNMPTGLDLGMAVGGVAQLISELQQLREDLINTVNYKIQEIDTKLQEQIDAIVDTTDILKKTQNEVLKHVKTIKRGPAGNTPDERAIEWRIKSNLNLPKPINIYKLEESILSKVPKLDKKALTNEIIQAIPKNKTSLKIIQERFEVDPMSVIEKIMELPPEKLKKLKLKKENIDGLEQTMSAFHNQLGRGYLHGGGDTVTAGTNVTITTNSAGRKVISATGGGSTAYENPSSGVINGVNNVFVFAHAPIALVTNSGTIFENDTNNITGYYTLSGTTATLKAYGGGDLILFPPSSIKGQYNA